MSMAFDPRRNQICVTFDLWGTLIFDEPPLDQVRGKMRCEGLSRVLSEAGIQLSSSDIEKAYEESAIRFQEIWLRNEEIQIDEQIDLIIHIATRNKMGIPQKPDVLEALIRAYVDPVLIAPPRLNPDASRTLDSLRHLVNKIGLISNTGRSPGTALRILLERYGILKWFDSTVFSNEVGWRKPDGRIFDFALKQLGAEPINVVHIGDDPEADIWGATQFGMHALLLDYELPEGFEYRPSSLFALSRSMKRIRDSEINPDARIHSIVETREFVESLSRS